MTTIKEGMIGVPITVSGDLEVETTALTIETLATIIAEMSPELFSRINQGLSKSLSTIQRKITGGSLKADLERTPTQIPTIIDKTTIREIPRDIRIKTTETITETDSTFQMIVLISIEMKTEERSIILMSRIQVRFCK